MCKVSFFVAIFDCRLAETLQLELRSGQCWSNNLCQQCPELSDLTSAPCHSRLAVCVCVCVPSLHTKLNCQHLPNLLLKESPASCFLVQTVPHVNTCLFEVCARRTCARGKSQVVLKHTKSRCVARTISFELLDMQALRSKKQCGKEAEPHRKRATLSKVSGGDARNLCFVRHCLTSEQMLTFKQRKTLLAQLVQPTLAGLVTVCAFDTVHFLLSFRLFCGNGPHLQSPHKVRLYSCPHVGCPLFGWDGPGRDLAGANSTTTAWLRRACGLSKSNTDHNGQPLTESYVFLDLFAKCCFSHLLLL